ncbi:HesA/MoeB/ThiF family protein [Flavobacteriaceae bacterium 3-367]
MTSNRYIRQTSLKEFGLAAQLKLGEAKVLVVGLGGLGVPVLQYLNAMGVGTLGLVEGDSVDLTNLQRQVLYSENDIGRPKLQVMLEKLKAQNSGTYLHAYDTFLTRDNALRIIAEYDVVVDATDNFATRYLINDTCVILKIPFVYGALHAFEGQVSVFNYKDGPTYRCLFPTMPSTAEIPNCDTHGVLGVIPGIIGNLQALEVVKIITGIGEILSGKLLLFNGLSQSYNKISLTAIPANLNRTRLEDSYGQEPCVSVTSITVNELQTMLSGSKSVQVIDVRTAREYADYKLPLTLNIPLDELENRIQELNLKQTVYFLCQSGKRSEIAIQKLGPKYPETVFYNILGGINTFLATCT